IKFAGGAGGDNLASTSPLPLRDRALPLDNLVIHAIEGQPDDVVLRGVPEGIHRVPALLHDVDLLHEHAAAQDQADVRLAELFFAAVHTWTLRGPGEVVLAAVVVQLAPDRQAGLVHTGNRHVVDRNLVVCLIRVFALFRKLDV